MFYVENMIFCLLLGEFLAKKYNFTVETDKLTYVSQLEKKIWSEKRNSLASVDARHLQLWKVDVSINDNKLDSINIDIEKELEGVMMFPADLISKHFNGNSL
ncbi:5380_t:CDS:1, partial [Gigaspora margarita]